MLEDGSFFGYVNSWSGRYLQETFLASYKRKHNDLGYSLEDFHEFHKESGMGEDEAVLLWIGDRTILKKKNDGFKLFVKAGPCWVRTAREITRLEDMCRASVLFPEVSVRRLCTEKEITKAKDPDALARKLAGRLSRCRYPAYFQFGDREIWYWDANSTGGLEVYGDYPIENIILSPLSGGLSDQIRKYKAARVLRFGEF